LGQTMKTFGIGAVLVFVASTAVVGSDLPPLADTEENRVAQAKRYLVASPIGDMLEDLAANMASTMPDRQAKELEELFTKHIDIDSLEESLRASMVKHFTAEELRALADFYGSPVGKSAMSKFGAYMADMMPGVQREVAGALQRAGAAE